MAGCPGFCGYYLSLCIVKCLSGHHNALRQMLLKKKMRCECFEPASNRPSTHFLADLPACHPVGLMLEPSGLAFGGSGGGQAPRMGQLCLPSTRQRPHDCRLYPHEQKLRVRNLVFNLDMCRRDSFSDVLKMADPRLVFPFYIFYTCFILTVFFSLGLLRPLTFSFEFCSEKSPQWKFFNLCAKMLSLSEEAREYKLRAYRVLLVAQNPPSYAQCSVPAIARVCTRASPFHSD